ncbi:MAG TPA: signal peptidase I [Ktedonobacterales bacterium]|nr:signal peptidase I [Ktedonobacterales bacterium]
MADARILPARTAGSTATENPSNFTREILETVILTLLIFFAIHFSIQPYFVDGPSMQPNLHTGDLVMVNLLSYDFGTPQRGDVIVFHPPDEPKLQYVKRIIGIPGDTVTVTPTAVYVDNVKLSEPYIYPLAAGQDESPVAIPAQHLDTGQYFVLGDNRDNSRDSRYFPTPVTREMIIGKVELVAWPFSAIEWMRSYSSVFTSVHQ